MKKISNEPSLRARQEELLSGLQLSRLPSVEPNVIVAQIEAIAAVSAIMARMI